MDKGGSYEPLVAAARGRVTRAFVYGEGRERLAEALERALPTTRIAASPAPWREPPSSLRTATWCCSRRRARATTSSRASRSAARCSVASWRPGIAAAPPGRRAGGGGGVVSTIGDLGTRAAVPSIALRDQAERRALVARAWALELGFLVLVALGLALVSTPRARWRSRATSRAPTSWASSSRGPRSRWRASSSPAARRSG